MQDEIALIPDRMSLSMGTKIERNNYTGVEVQPSLRLMCNPSKGQAFWGAFSRSVSTPSRLDSDASAVLAIQPTPIGLPAVLQFQGHTGLRVESQLTGEVGYRAELGKSIEVDWTAFYNDYRDLTSIEPQRERMQLQPVPHLAVPLLNQNSMDGESYGTEMAVHYTPRPWWRITGSYSWLRVQLHHRPFSRWEFAEAGEASTPRHQGSVRSYIDLPKGFQLDALVYSVGALGASAVKRYVRGDLRLGWEPRPGWELSVQGQNLLGGSHLEFLTEEPFLRPVWIERGVTFRLGRRF
jgi:iron complex outermembrane receptor protein